MLILNYHLKRAQMVIGVDVTGSADKYGYI